MESTYRAWLAGFFDGEGSVSAFSNNGHWHPILVLVQKDRGVLEDVRARLGCGRIVVFKRTGVHALRFSGRDCALLFIEAVLPYAVVKRERLEIARELALTIKQGQTVTPELAERRRVLAERLRVRPRRVDSVRSLV